MHKKLARLTVEKVQQRVSEGDCPVTPAYSVEWLEDALLSLAGTPETPSTGVEASAWLIEFPESGDSYEGGKRVGPATPRQYYGGTDHPNGGRTSRTEDHNHAIRYARKCDAEQALALLNQGTQFPSHTAFVSEHKWLATPSTEGVA